jgi:diguanylate cyclase (GGDEF)-like protein
VDEMSGETPRRGSGSPPRRYYLLLRRSRLMAVAFWVATGYFFFWAIPWFPGGLNEKDYTGRVALTLILGGVCVVLGIGTLILREYLRRTREALLAWTTVYDDTTGLYNRRYFYDRLSLECERARRQGTTFSLVVMHFEHGGGHGRGPSAGGLRRLAGALTRATRSEDMVALVGGNELAVVAMGVSRKMVPQVIERLKRALEGSLVDSGERLDLRLGASTYGARCRHPSTLLRLARGSLDERPAGGTEEKEDLVA